MLRGLVFNIALAVALSGCATEHPTVVDGVPLHRNDDAGVMNVYLAVDGVSHEAALEAQRLGAFTGFALAKSIPMFPATSDASWSRILRTEPFGGYEVTYYDAESDQIRNRGLAGLMAHAAPHGHGSEDFPYYDAFDVHASGYLNVMARYAAPEQMFVESLNHLFAEIGKRVGRQTHVTGYILETDVVAHTHGNDAMVEMLVQLSDRIKAFKAAHPEVRFRFTLFSDHGTDDTPKPLQNFIHPADLLKTVGVAPVPSFADAAKKDERLWAVAPEHTRVTYGSMHTRPDLIAPVAQRVSIHPAVDLVVARAEAPEDAPQAAQWISLWAGGEERVRFGFDAASDTYWLPATTAYQALDVELDMPRNQQWHAFSDEELFAATVDRRYPDLFFRARTGLLPISVKNAADILYSLNEDWAVKGFAVPLADKAGSGASHGAMAGKSSHAIVMSEERPLPSAVRSDNILELFPGLSARLDELGVTRSSGDPHAALAAPPGAPMWWGVARLR